MHGFLHALATALKYIKTCCVGTLLTWQAGEKFFEISPIEEFFNFEALDIRDIRVYCVDPRCGRSEFIDRGHLLLDRVSEDLIGVAVAL